VTVHLIGAGPGDPDLLTVRAAELLRAADVVVSDRPSSDPVVALAPERAERVLVGKVPAADGAPARRALPQDDVCALLVELGRSGREVVRLKSGDPFVAARGGEEALALQAAGVPFTVVPGISAGLAAPAFAGIPVHVRQLSRVVTVLAGNSDPEYPAEVDYDALARLGGTIVVLTGRSRIRRIAGSLIAAGMPADTPVAAVSAAGRAGSQETIRGTLAALPPRLPAPVTFVIGTVAGLDLDWFADGRSSFATADDALAPVPPKDVPTAEHEADADDEPEADPAPTPRPRASASRRSPAEDPLQESVRAHP
jgi:uroporphyrin-III C-methyltransferase/uroporphyrinogen III methyltransferase/synthase